MLWFNICIKTMSVLQKKSVKGKVNVQLNQSASRFVVDTDKDDISLPAVIVFSGARGSGKTYSCITLMRHFELKDMSHVHFCYVPPDIRTICTLIYAR